MTLVNNVLLWFTERISHIFNSMILIDWNPIASWMGKSDRGIKDAIIANLAMSGDFPLFSSATRSLSSSTWNQQSTSVSAFFQKLHKTVIGPLPLYNELMSLAF